MKENAMSKDTALFGTRIGDADWQEQLITEVAERIPGARDWAKANGFDRLRVVTIDLDAPPDFTQVVNEGKTQ